jgi:hypothetical protein
VTTLPFKTSEPYTLGVELELQVLNSRDYNLTGAAADLLAVLEQAPHPGDIKPEITEGMIEISTSIQHGYTGLLGELIGIRDAMVRQAERLNLGIAGGGAHPFQKWHDQRIFDAQRYRHIHELYGYLAKQFTVFGQHIHIGCDRRHRGAAAPSVPRYIRIHRTVGLLAVPGRGHRLRLVAAEQRERLPARRAHAPDGRLGRVHRVLRADAPAAGGGEHEGLLLGHPAQARIRDYRSARVRHTVDPGASCRAGCLCPGAGALAVGGKAAGAVRGRVPGVWLQPLPRLSFRTGCRDHRSLRARKRLLAEDIGYTLGQVQRFADDEEEGATALLRLREVAAGRRGDSVLLREQLARSKSLSDVVHWAAEQWMRG